MGCGVSRHGRAVRGGGVVAESSGLGESKVLRADSVGGEEYIYSSVRELKLTGRSEAKAKQAV